MQTLKKYFEDNDRFAKHCGIELLEVTPGGAKAKMPLSELHWNGIKTVHGGAIFTLADFTFAAASNSREQIAVAVSATISYTKAAQTGALHAEAKEISLNRKLSTYLITITDDSGETVALFHGTAYRKNEKHTLSS